MTFSVAFASGVCVASTESGGSQLRVARIDGVESVSKGDVDELKVKWDTSSRKRQTVSAANMSPVPEKKIGKLGASM